MRTLTDKQDTENLQWMNSVKEYSESSFQDFNLLVRKQLVTLLPSGGGRRQSHVHTMASSSSADSKRTAREFNDQTMNQLDPDLEESLLDERGYMRFNNRRQYRVFSMSRGMWLWNEEEHPDGITWVGHRMMPTPVAVRLEEYTVISPDRVRCFAFPTGTPVFPTFSSTERNLPMVEPRASYSVVSSFPPDIPTVSAIYNLPRPPAYPVTLGAWYYLPVIGSDLTGEWYYSKRAKPQHLETPVGWYFLGCSTSAGYWFWLPRHPRMYIRKSSDFWWALNVPLAAKEILSVKKEPQ